MKVSSCYANEYRHASEGVPSLGFEYRLNKHDIVEVHKSDGLQRAFFNQTAGVNTISFNCRG
jgi:hypothetical protein